MNLPNTARITYVIGYRHSPDRLKNLKRILEWLAPFQGMEILLIEQDKYSKISEMNLRLKHIFIKSDMPYNRSWAFNIAAKFASTPIIVFGDSDLIMNPSDLISSIKALENYDVVNPYNSVIDLTENESNMDINSILQINRIGRGDAPEDIQKTNLCGGIVIFKKEKFFQIGGFPEDFLGWGGEDDMTTIKVKSFLNYTTLPNKCYHFHHEKANIDMKLYQRNLSILEHFRKATKDQLRQHINMVLPKIGQINKYS